MTPLSHILEHKIVAIIRGANPGDLQKIALALVEGGIRTMEITLNSPGALASIEALAGAMGDRLLVGAGTVLDAESARAALLAGARFIISPTLDKETIRMTRRYGAVSIPGAFTATEILSAYEHGADIVKVFPASVGAAYFREMAGPLPFIPLMPTGGVSLDNIGAFRQAGAAAFGLGSSLVNSRTPATLEGMQELTARAREFVRIVTTSA
ncbi:MAG: 2-dehydro-3-deoxyphosphogluconate aldolase [Variovorax sp.]|nr:2-dehydro-3-deoxyphosphogluconate aldolase [Variovorax sp.]